MHGLEKRRFLICTLRSASGQLTCSRVGRQRVTGSLPGRERAPREGRSSSPQQESYKGWIEKRGRLFTLFFYHEDAPNIFQINKVGLGRGSFTILTGIAFFYIQNVRGSGQNRGSLLSYELLKFTGRSTSLLLTKSLAAHECDCNPVVGEGQTFATIY